jgi:pimeloyl-ACP methyl ester carboxylesterase
MGAMDRDARRREDTETQPPAAVAESKDPQPAGFSDKGQKPEVATAAAAPAAVSASDQAFGAAETKPEAKPEVKAEGEKQPDLAEIRQDSLYEHLAHRFAYKKTLSPEDHKYLEQHNLKFGEHIRGHGGLDMMTFIPLNGNQPPVLAFRGTSEIPDVVDDANAEGVGANQMAMNEGLIDITLEQLALSYGAVTVTGHSLGGALAQMAAARAPDYVGHVVTFQSPGVPKSMVEKLDKHNEEAKEEGKDPIESQHYAVKGDLIPLAGEAFTSGFRTVIERGTDPMQDNPLEYGVKPVASLLQEHQSLPLDEFEQSGEGQKPEPEGMHKLDGRSPAHATSADVNYHESEKAHKFVEAVRVGMAHVLDKLAGFGNEGKAPREAYVHVWEQVRAAIDAGASEATLVALINHSQVRDEDKQLMLTNLGEIEQAQHAVK